VRLEGGKQVLAVGGAVTHGRAVVHREALHAQLPPAPPGIRDRRRGSGRNWTGEAGSTSTTPIRRGISERQRPRHWGRRTCGARMSALAVSGNWIEWGVCTSWSQGWRKETGNLIRNLKKITRERPAHGVSRTRALARSADPGAE
jgi:hypothetical protein